MRKWGDRFWGNVYDCRAFSQIVLGCRFVFCARICAKTSLTPSRTLPLWKTSYPNPNGSSLVVLEFLRLAEICKAAAPSLT